MDRGSHMTTRIHDPPAPPFWFRSIFYSLSFIWLTLQGLAIMYDVQTLERYAYTQLFDYKHDRQIDAVFVNIIVTGLLTVGLVIVHAYGICTKSKLMVAGCSAFGFVIWILNVLCIVVLHQSNFMINHGPYANGVRQLTIYHKNMTKEHWKEELKVYAKQFPVNQTLPTPPWLGAELLSTTLTPLVGNLTTVDASDTDSPPNTGAPPDMGGGGGVADNTTQPSHHRRGITGGSVAADTTEPSLRRRGSTDRSVAPTLYLDVLRPADGNRTALLMQWYTQQEGSLLATLSFVQQAGFCCGVDSVDDYRKLSAHMAISCRCNMTMAKHVHVHCSRKGHTMMNGALWTVWNRPCGEMLHNFRHSLHELSVFLIAAVVPQTVVVLMSVVLAINMPKATKEDNADDY